LVSTVTFDKIQAVLVFEALEFVFLIIRGSKNRGKPERAREFHGTLAYFKFNMNVLVFSGRDVTTVAM